MRMNRGPMLLALTGSLCFASIAPLQAETRYECGEHGVTIYPFWPSDPPPDLCEVEQSVIEGYCDDGCQECNMTYEGGDALMQLAIPSTVTAVSKTRHQMVPTALRSCTARFVRETPYVRGKRAVGRSAGDDTREAHGQMPALVK